MVRTQVLLTPTLIEEIKELAEDENKSISKVVREILSKELKSSKKRKKSGVEFLKELVNNAFKGGPKDLSANDDYLYE